MMKMMNLLSLTIYLSLLFCPQASKIEIHQQIGWSLSNKWPIEPIHINKDRGKTTSHEIIGNKNRIGKIVKKLEAKANYDSIRVHDIRLVAIISCLHKNDTLKIDEKGHCQFRNKKFALDNDLAVDLKVRSTEFNPRYKIKGSYKPKGSFDDWK